MSKIYLDSCMVIGLIEDDVEQRTVLKKQIPRHTVAGSGLVEIVSRYTQTFLWLQRYDEGMLTEPGGLAALTLLVAKSDPKQKETLIRLIMNLLALKQEGING